MMHQKETLTMTALCKFLSNLVSLLIFTACFLCWQVFPQALPPPWQDSDIGSPASLGSAKFLAPASFTVNGAGSDIWGNTDQFNFLFQPLVGDGEIVARVVSQQNTNVWAKAGLMIRDTLTPGSVNAFLAITPGNGIEFQRRRIANNISVRDATFAVAPPTWLRLVRAGSTFTAYRSSDGLNWISFGNDTLPISQNAFIGLAVCSHSPTILSTVSFDGAIVIKANLPPVLTILTTTVPTAVVINAAASDPDGRIAKVEFYQGNVLLGTSITPPYSFTWNSVPPGTYNITAKAFDDRGAVTTSPVIVNTVGGGFYTNPCITGTAYRSAAVGGAISLSWSYDSQVAIDGFKIVSIAGTQISTEAVIADPLVRTWQGTVTATKEFFVRSYRGNLESPGSNHVLMTIAP